MPNTAAEVIPVAVGVLIEEGRVLISKRPVGVHLANYWEFPGGKIEPNENLEDALKREFKEELNIRISGISPLMEVQYNYPEKQVCLKVCRISTFEGVAYGQEGQEILWCGSDRLDKLEFPPANTRILEYVRRALQSA